MDATDRMIAVPAVVLADLLDLSERALGELRENDPLHSALRGAIDGTRTAIHSLAPA